MIKNLQTITINSLLGGPPLNIFFGYKTNTQKTSVLNDVIDISFSLKRQIFYVDIFSTFLQLGEKPENMTIISPFGMSLQQFFSILLSCPRDSIIVIDSYPLVVNAFFKEEEKANRLFLYFLAKKKHFFHIIVFVYADPEKGTPSFSIFNKIFYDKLFLHKSN